MKLRFAVVLALATSSASGGLARPITNETKLPIVACPRDGQADPNGGNRAPSRTGNVPKVPSAAASKLAYYASVDLGVLAPRGWSCVGFSGSSGYGLLVTPYSRRKGDFFRRRLRFLGPAVAVRYSYGNTSGRTAVLDAIARYFPARHDVIQEIRGSERIIGPLPHGPYPADILGRRERNVIRFTTPAGETGEGTTGFMAPGTDAIEGLRRLIETPDGPDLLAVDIRLPSEPIELRDVILSSARREQ